MNKGTFWIIMAFFAAVICCAHSVSADIYKVVDKDGNVTFTDQPPGDGSTPMDLPPLSVVESAEPAVVGSAQEDRVDEADENDPAELKPAELRKLYRDFRIIQPQNEETFWGTANTVFVSWGSSASATVGMKASLFVDGQAQEIPPTGGLELTLDRGEHQVYAELQDPRGRVIVTSKTVTFYVKQSSVRMNSPQATPGKVN